MQYYECVEELSPKNGNIKVGQIYKVYYESGVYYILHYISDYLILAKIRGRQFNKYFKKSTKEEYEKMIEREMK